MVAGQSDLSDFLDSLGLPDLPDPVKELVNPTALQEMLDRNTAFTVSTWQSIFHYQRRFSLVGLDLVRAMGTRVVCSHLSSPARKCPVCAIWRDILVLQMENVLCFIGPEFRNKDRF